MRVTIKFGIAFLQRNLKMNITFSHLQKAFVPKATFRSATKFTPLQSRKFVTVRPDEELSYGLITPRR